MKNALVSLVVLAAACFSSFAFADTDCLTADGDSRLHSLGDKSMLVSCADVDAANAAQVEADAKTEKAKEEKAAEEVAASSANETECVRSDGTTRLNTLGDKSLLPSCDDLDRQRQAIAVHSDD